MATQVKGRSRQKTERAPARLRGAATTGAAAARDMATQVREAASGAASVVAERAPQVAGATAVMVADAMQQIERGSDEMLLGGAALALGLTVGLIAGGANRYVALLALIPATAMGITLLERRAAQGTASAEAASDAS
ncbi:MAG TPA: hypothetical protein VIM30_17195 [Candidatus Limnocylindrales bacterium]